MVDNKENDPHDESKISSGQISNPASEEKNVELTEEQRQKRALEVWELFENKKGLIEARAEREKKKKEEVVELRSGAKFTIGEIERIVIASPSPYAPLFSYAESDYFKETYRMYSPERDYKEWPKPYYNSVLFKQLIYDRFDKAVFTALDFHNPIIAGRKCRIRKLFQHLNEIGQQEEMQFRDDVVNVARTITTDGDWYSFRKKMWELHKVPYQMDYFKEQKN